MLRYFTEHYQPSIVRSVTMQVSTGVVTQDMTNAATNLLTLSEFRCTALRVTKHVTT